MLLAWRRAPREHVLRDRRPAGLSRLAGVAGGPLYARRRLFDHRQLEGRGSPGGRKGPAGGLSHGPQGSRRRQTAKPRRCVGGRTEENTPEHQQLMRISAAVLWLKKKI